MLSSLPATVPNQWHRTGQLTRLNLPDGSNVLFGRIVSVLFDGFSGVLCIGISADV